MLIRGMSVTDLADLVEPSFTVSVVWFVSTNILSLERYEIGRYRLPTLLPLPI